MIPAEEIKNQNFKVFLGMPMYGGMLTENTMHGLLSLQQWTMTNGVGLRFQSMGNESLITRARNTIVTMMLDQTDYVSTHLLFIDSDIGFSAENIQRLLQADKDVVCGIYPRKYIHLDKIKKILEESPNASDEEIEAKALGYNLNFDNPEGVGVEHGYCRVNEAATGMMLVKREVFTKMQEAYPDRKYESDQIINGQPFRSDNCYDLFSVGPYMTAGQKRYLSEDYYFSRLWQELGGEIWADVSMPLTHFGNRAFKGHVGALFAAKK